MYYNISNILVREPRFVSEITIWEFLFFCDHNTYSFEKMRKITLLQKIYYLVRTYLFPTSNSKSNLRIFQDLRNQITHHGKFQIQDNSSPFQTLTWPGCKMYMDFFSNLTHVLVLVTLGLKPIHFLKILNADYQLNELIKTGRINYFDSISKHSF